MSKLADLSLSQSWRWLRRVSRILWVRVAMISVLSLLAALSANVLDPLIPEVSKDRFSPEATLPVLNVLASSMLAVATFSLGIMVSSHRTLASQATPRIHQLLIEDTSTQTVLATFIGAFVYALSAIILFRAGYYDENASVIVFGTTVLVVLTIVVSLLRWIGRLSRISSLDYALDRAETAASEVLRDWAKWPAHGCHPLRRDMLEDSSDVLVHAERSGYVLRLQLADLQKQAKKDAVEVFMAVSPGDHVLEGEVLARVRGPGNPDGYVDSIVLGPNRSYEQDPRYAIQALREGAQKALSPGVNDPGTALSIITRLHRLLWKAFSKRKETDVDHVPFDRIHIADVAAADLLTQALRDIARDGREFVEVLIATRQSATALAREVQDTGPETDELLTDIDAYALGLNLDREIERYRQVVDDLA